VSAAVNAGAAASGAGPEAQGVDRSHRGTIALEDAPLIAHTDCGAEQYVMRLAAPRCAARATPGSFVHLQCSAELLMRRPLSIQRVNAAEGWIEVLYKVVGLGTEALRARKVGETLSVMGPIGKGFSVHAARPRVLALGGGVGIPPMIFLAESLRTDTRAEWKPLVLMGSEIAYPFKTRPSRILVPGMPDEAIACMPLLDEWHVPSRLASLSDFPGCYSGYVTDLARAWLKTLDAAQLAEVEIFACGPTPMLAAVAALAREFALPCQVSLEEFMACAVGGCAGCAVPVQTADGLAMKKVCVDGPVFEAQTVFWKPVAQQPN
jgi:dihydroorotate dehydrogenase electron transfer subunit